MLHHLDQCNFVNNKMSHKYVRPSLTFCDFFEFCCGKQKYLSPSIFRCVTEVNAAKLAPFILFCLMALTAAFSMGFALASGVTRQIEAALSRENIEVNGVASVWALNSRILGDPIKDPKPNGHRESG